MISEIQKVSRIIGDWNQGDDNAIEIFIVSQNKYELFCYYEEMQQKEFKIPA
jgi:hypothetical protein